MFQVGESSNLNIFSLPPPPLISLLFKQGIIGIVILGVACAAVMVCAVRMMYKEREGDPIFKSQLLMPTDSSNEGGPKGPERT